WRAALPDSEETVVRAATAALGATAGDVVVLLTDDAAVRELDARIRGQDKPTNVRSFPAPAAARPHRDYPVPAWGVCAAEAQDQAKTVADHLAHLVVHGVMHLLGRDHEIEAEAEAMEAEERTILASLGISDPYLSRDGT